MHLKVVIVDGAVLYLGSANWTGAGLGAKGSGRRNFELGFVTDDGPLLDQIQALYERIWTGGECAANAGCARSVPGRSTTRRAEGKIVLLDFWTFCCINCHHVLPDLAKLEEKYKDELVVIGVHTAKFTAEQDTENIRRKVREYRIKHPVVNDANQVIWRRFGVQSWPTLALIDAKGQFVGMLSGEGHYEQLDRVIGQLVAKHKELGELNLSPLKFNPEMERPSDGPLLFPGKVVADAEGRDCSSPTPATTGSSRPASTARTRSPSATARRASRTVRSRRLDSIGRRGFTSTATRSSSPTPRTMRSGPSTSRRGRSPRSPARESRCRGWSRSPSRVRPGRPHFRVPGT